MTEPKIYNEKVVNDLIVAGVSRPGWTQKRLADALGIRPQTVNKWVKGENTPPPDRWPAIEEALEFDPGTFWRQVIGADGVDFFGSDFFRTQLVAKGKPVDEMTTEELLELRREVNRRLQQLKSQG